MSIFFNIDPWSVGRCVYVCSMLLKCDASFELVLFNPTALNDDCVGGKLPTQQ